MNRRLAFLLLPLLILFLGISTGCSNKPDDTATPYRKDNEHFFNSFANNTAYKRLLFANEDYPIYYKVLREAPPENKGKKPLQNSRVKVFTSGKLMSGEYFEQPSEKPSVLDVYNARTGGGVIKGFRIALQNMDVGDKWEVVIPWQLGYGSYTQGYLIPAYSTLIFTIDLQEIVSN